MRFEGYLIRPGKGRYWAVEIPCLGIHTQGTSKKDAYEMAKDAIEMLVDDPNFSVVIHAHSRGGLQFTIAPSDSAPMIALILKRLRSQKGLSVRQVAERIGSKSPTSYSQYESGKAAPSFAKFDQLLRAIDPEYEPVLRIG